MHFQTSPVVKSISPAQETPIRTLLTVQQFSKKYPAFSVRSLRHLIFLAKHRHTCKGILPGNGLGKALIRVGRKLLIDEAKFFDWIEQQQMVS